MRYAEEPVALMVEEDKAKAVGFLSNVGAFPITKSCQKVCAKFGTSKFTLYSYTDEAKSKAAE